MKLLKVRCKDYREGKKDLAIPTPAQEKEIQKFRKAFNFEVDRLRPRFGQNILHGDNNYFVAWGRGCMVILDFSKNPKGDLLLDPGASSLERKKFQPGQYEQVKKYIKKAEETNAY